MFYHQDALYPISHILYEIHTCHIYIDFLKIDLRNLKKKYQGRNGEGVGDKNLDILSFRDCITCVACLQCPEIQKLKMVEVTNNMSKLACNTLVSIEELM